MKPYQRFIKRTFDLILSIVGLTFLWPVILLCILLARIDTKLSGVFTQRRIGLNGETINVYKIRSMQGHFEANANTVTTSSDVRITRIGKFLRKCKLDELPQLWNVLKGDMSFVGPRPDVPGYADQLIEEQRIMLSVRPGITGPSTIKYRNEESILNSVDDAIRFNNEVIYPDKVAINIAYINEWSFVKDVKYILMTIHFFPIPNELNVSRATYVT